MFEDKKEPTALLQYNGGPCSCIAAVQAFLLRELLFCTKCDDNWRHPDGNLIGFSILNSTSCTQVYFLRK